MRDEDDLDTNSLIGPQDRGGEAIDAEGEPDEQFPGDNDESPAQNPTNGR
jgi:hypothetical protein